MSNFVSHPGTIRLLLQTFKNGAPANVNTKDLFAGKKVALFAVPGAFTPTCSQVHLCVYSIGSCLFATSLNIFFDAINLGSTSPTQQHLPGFIKKANDFKTKGIDEIMCLAVNDAFVMDAWAKDQGVQDQVLKRLYATSSQIYRA